MWKTVTALKLNLEPPLQIQLFQDIAGFIGTFVVYNKKKSVKPNIS